MFSLNAPNSFAAITLAPEYSGAVTFARDIAVAVMSQANQTVMLGVGTVLDAHQYTMNGGTIQGDGVLIITGVLGDPGLLMLNPQPIQNEILPGAVSISANSQFTIASNVKLSTAVTNSGTLLWQGGAIKMDSAGVITNNGSLLVQASGASMTQGGTINNAGSIVFNVGVNTTAVTEAFLNDLGGTVEVDQGQVFLGGGMLLDGTIDIAANATLTLAGATTFSTMANGGAGFTGTGQLVVKAELKELSPTPLPIDVHLILDTSGILTGSGYAVQKSFTWQNGVIRETQVTVSSGTSVVGAPVFGSRILQDSTLTLVGPTIWVQGDIAFDNGILVNQGAFEIRSTGKMGLLGGGGLFDNRTVGAAVGTVTKTTANATTIETDFWNGGVLALMGVNRTLNFKRGLTQFVGGMTILGGGTINLDNFALGTRTFVMQGGLLTGGGRVEGYLDNSHGVVSVGAGVNNTLTVTEDYTQGISGTLEIKASNAQDWGSLKVTKNASLNGDLLVQMVGGYNPAQGFEKEIIDAGTRVGTFASTPAAWETKYNGPKVSVKKR